MVHEPPKRARRCQLLKRLREARRRDQGVVGAMRHGSVPGCYIGRCLRSVGWRLDLQERDSPGERRTVPMSVYPCIIGTAHLFFDARSGSLLVEVPSRADPPHAPPRDGAAGQGVPRRSDARLMVRRALSPRGDQAERRRLTRARLPRARIVRCHRGWGWSGCSTHEPLRSPRQESLGFGAFIVGRLEQRGETRGSHATRRGATFGP